MKNQSFVIIEYHPDYGDSAGQCIRQTITTWLTKALHQ